MVDSYGFKPLLLASAEEDLAADAVVIVTERISTDGLVHDLKADPDAMAASGISTVSAIGDAFAPGPVVAAVHSGHLAARLHGTDGADAAIFRDERTAL